MKEFKFSNRTEHDYLNIAALQSEPPGKRKFRIFLFTIVLAGGAVIYSFFSQFQTTKCKAIVRTDFRTVSALARGALTRVYYEEGNSFTKGALLAEMDKSSLNSEILFLNRKILLVKSAIAQKEKLLREADSYNLRKWNWQREERKKKLEAERFQLELGEKEAQYKILEFEGKLADLVGQITRYKRLIIQKAATNRQVRTMEKEKGAIRNRLEYWRGRLMTLNRRRVGLASAVYLTSYPQVKAKVEGVSSLKMKLSDFDKQLEEVKRKLKYSEMRAYCDGVVLELLKREGDELKENETFLTFYQKDKLWLEAYAVPADISKVTVGSRVDLINAEGKLFSQAGQVTRIMPQLRQLPKELIKPGYNNENYYRVKIHLNNSLLRPVFLYPGSPLDVSISRETIFRGLSVPAWL